MNLIVKLVLGVAFLGGIGAIVAANFQRGEGFFNFKWKIDREAPMEAQMAPVTRGRVVRTVEAPGKVESDEEVKISSQVMGRITKLAVKEGQIVGPGDLLVEIDREQFQSEVDASKARIDKLKKSIESAQLDCKRLEQEADKARRLHEQNAETDTKVKEAVTAFQTAKVRVEIASAELNEARFSLQRSEKDLKNTIITAPRGGIVSQLLAKEGEIVVIGTMNNAGTQILSLSERESMIVRARVDENNVIGIRPGQKTTIHLHNVKEPLTGTVLRISPKALSNATMGAAAPSAAGTDNQLAIFETIISVENPPDYVRFGMNANVEIHVEEKNNVLSIPTQAVLHRRAKDLPSEMVKQAEDAYVKRQSSKDNARRYYPVVFVESEGKARLRLVKTGISDENRVEIEDGLREGEKVIIGPYRLFDKLGDGKPVVESSDRSGDE